MSVERQDKFLTCKDCGEDFIFTVREQDFYLQKGFENDPARCGPCRNARKRDRQVNSISSGNGFGNNFAGFNSRPANQRPNNYGNGGGNYNNPRNNHYGNNNGGNYNRGNGGGNYGNGGGNYNRGNGGGNYGNYNNSGYNQRQPGNYGNGGGGNYGNNNHYSNGGGNYGNGNYGGGYGNGNYQMAGNSYGQEERKMYPITCMNCGIETEVPFAPRQGVPVFCRSCYNKQKGR